MLRPWLLSLGLLLCSLLAVEAGPTKRPSLAQLEAQHCALVGQMAAYVAEVLAKGVAYQTMLDEFDKLLAESPRTPAAIAQNKVWRRLTTTIALNPTWTATQAQISLEMACLRGEYAF